MLIFQFMHELRAHLTKDGVVPKDTGNLQEKGFNIRNFGVRTIGMTYGDPVNVPYAVIINRGFIHYRTRRRVSGGYTGRKITKHKGWLEREVNVFVDDLAQRLGGTVTYD